MKGFTLNGDAAQAAVKGAVFLLFAMIAAITAIIISGKTVPEVFVSGFTLLVGFIIGSRVVTGDVQEAVNRKTEARNAPAGAIDPATGRPYTRRESDGQA